MRLAFRNPPFLTAFIINPFFASRLGLFSVSIPDPLLIFGAQNNFRPILVVFGGNDLELVRYRRLKLCFMRVDLRA